MKWIVWGLGTLIALGGIGVLAFAWIANPRVVRELREDPTGERAKQVMLLTLPSGKALPVNYLREGDVVYAAADFPWWRELRDGGGRGSVLIQGQTLEGRMRAVLDEPERRADVFSRLRPTAPLWAGTLIVIELEEPAP